jgi:hypothetical protein
VTERKMASGKAMGLAGDVSGRQRDKLSEIKC